jgi:ferritin
MLNEQIGHELQASQEYLSVSVYFAMKQLDGWAAFFRRQSDEERSHAMKIFDYLLSIDAQPEIPALAAVKIRFKDDLEPVKQSLSWEQTVTKQFHEMAERATLDKDYTTLNFLQWFIVEQIEEENTMEKLVAMIESGINMFQAEPLLPKPEDLEVN